MVNTLLNSHMSIELSSSPSKMDLEGSYSHLLTNRFSSIVDNKKKTILKMSRSDCSSWVINDFAMLRFAVGSLKTSIQNNVVNSSDIKTSLLRKGLSQDNHSVSINNIIDISINKLISDFKIACNMLPADILKRTDSLSSKMVNQFSLESPVKKEINLEIFAIKLIINRFFGLNRRNFVPAHALIGTIISKEKIYSLLELLYKVLGDKKSSDFPVEHNLAKELCFRRY